MNVNLFNRKAREGKRSLFLPDDFCLLQNQGGRNRLFARFGYLSELDFVDGPQ
jgi:hypothetical protein